MWGGMEANSLHTNLTVWRIVCFLFSGWLASSEHQTSTKWNGVSAAQKRTWWGGVSRRRRVSAYKRSGETCSRILGLSATFGAVLVDHFGFGRWSTNIRCRPPCGAPQCCGDHPSLGADGTPIDCGLPGQSAQRTSLELPLPSTIFERRDRGLFELVSKPTPPSNGAIVHCDVLWQREEDAGAQAQSSALRDSDPECRGPVFAADPSVGVRISRRR